MGAIRAYIAHSISRSLVVQMLGKGFTSSRNAYHARLNVAWNEVRNNRDPDAATQPNKLCSTHSLARSSLIRTLVCGYSLQKLRA